MNSSIGMNQRVRHRARSLVLCVLQQVCKGGEVTLKIRNKWSFSVTRLRTHYRDRRQDVAQEMEEN